MAEVVLNDVTLRDGLQSFKKFIPTEKKIELANKIIDSGIKYLEITSFVSPKAIPQFKDSVALSRDRNLKDAFFSALVPNLKGFRNLLNGRINEAVLFVSACEMHNIKNLGKKIDETLSDFKEIFSVDSNVKIKGAISMVFGSPFTGELPRQKDLYKIIEFFLKENVSEITLCDTWGRAEQDVFSEQLIKILDDFDAFFSIHLHNVSGKAISNLGIAIDEGIRKVDTVFGVTGGCPFSIEAGINLNIREALKVIKGKNCKTAIDEEKIDEIENYLIKIIGGEQHEL